MRRYRNEKDTKKTNAWLKSNGISAKKIYLGTSELFQAQKLATNMLRNYGSLLDKNQSHVLRKFLLVARNGKKRLTITQGQCFKVLNITKQVQRKYAKMTKRKTTGEN